MNLSSPKQPLGCMAVMLVAVFAISYGSTRSLNPVTVYTSGGILAKIFVSLLALFIIGIAMQLIGYLSMRAVIARTSHKAADDVICPGCGHALVPFISSHGAPIRCPLCRTWWHNGPACFHRDSPGKQRMIRPCPNCVLAASGDRDLFEAD